MLEEIMRQPLVPFDTPVEDEGDIIWEYFQHYRDMGPERTKAALTHIEVGGKTRDASQIGKWAKAFQWEFRAHAYDMANAQKAQEEVILKREGDLAEFINDDIDFAQKMQRIGSKMADAVEKAIDAGETVDPGDYRTIAWGYREARTWVKDTLVFTYGDGRAPEHHG